MPVFPVALEEGSSHSDYNPKYTRTGEVLHTGCVLMCVRRESRVMSDVYAEVTHAIVWDPPTGAPIEVYLSTCGFGMVAEAEADATPEVLAHWAQYRAELADRAEKAQHLRRCEAARLRLLEPKVGCPARVVRGRKVPVGTEGVVTWKGSGNFGVRLAITDAQGVVHYTAFTNVERIIQQEEGESWLDTERRLFAPPACKWDAVRITSGPCSGVEGTLFYINSDRVGIATTNRKHNGRYVDVVWSHMASVAVTEARNGVEPPFSNVQEPAAPRKQVEAPF